MDFHEFDKAGNMAINGSACQAKQRLSQATVLAYLPEGTKIQELFLGMSLDEWEVVSFNPLNREVCVKILDTDVVISFIIPTVIFTP